MAEQPRVESLASSRSMRGMARITGTQWCTAQKWLMRIPMSRTTTSPSAAAVVRPGKGFANMSASRSPCWIALLSNRHMIG